MLKTIPLDKDSTDAISTAVSTARYGTCESPISIDQARAQIRDDYLRFADLVISQVQLPEGYTFTTDQHELKWFLGCEVLSSDSGLNFAAHRAISDDMDDFQLYVSVRYFHPELHYFKSRKSMPLISRRFSKGFSAHLWVDQGRPYWGMHKSLFTGGNEFCRSMASPEELAAEVVTRLRCAIQRRAMPEAKTAPT